MGVADAGYAFCEFPADVHQLYEYVCIYVIDPLVGGVGCCARLKGEPEGVREGSGEESAVPQVEWGRLVRWVGSFVHSST